MAARVHSTGKAAVDERATSAFAAGLLRWEEAGHDNEAAVAPGSASGIHGRTGRSAQTPEARPVSASALVRNLSRERWAIGVRTATEASGSAGDAESVGCWYQQGRSNRAGDRTGMHPTSCFGPWDVAT